MSAPLLTEGMLCQVTAMEIHHRGSSVREHQHVGGNGFRMSWPNQRVRLEKKTMLYFKEEPSTVHIWDPVLFRIGLSIANATNTILGCVNSNPAKQSFNPFNTSGDLLKYDFGFSA